MFKKALLFACLILFYSRHAQSQNFDRDNYINSLVPPSPSAAALQKYNNFPMDYSTGIPEISYTLYTIDADGLKIPITLSYHAGGIKVDDIGTAVGLGWTLQTGGGIYRQINGLPDETPTNGFLFDYRANSTYVNSINSYLLDSAAPTQTLGLLAQNYWDVTQDDYSFNFLGHTGSMYFNKNKKLTLAEKSNLIIRDSIQNLSGTNSYIFSATDDRGNQYSFNASGFSNSVTTCTTTGSTHTGTGQTDWMLTNITTPTKRSVNFSYQNYSTTYTVSSNDLYDIKGSNSGADGWSTCDFPACHSGPTQLYLYNKQHTHWNMLVQNIVSGNDSIRFIYSTSPNAINWQTQLDSIKIFSNGKLLRIVHFNYSVFNGDPRLKLIGFQNIGIPDNNSEPYQFSYYDGGGRALPSVDTRAKDMFGFYNGATTNSTLIYSSDAQCPFKANRNNDTSKVLNGTLNKIVLPTGGQINYIFEANDLGSGTYFGGVRLKKKIVFDPVSNSTTTENFTYQNAYGVRGTNGLSVIEETNGVLYFFRYFYNSNSYPLDQLGTDRFSKVGYLYKNVTDDKISTAGDTLRTIYQYQNFTIGKNLKGFPVNISNYTKQGNQFVLTKAAITKYTSLTVDSLYSPRYALGKGVQHGLVTTYDSDNLCCAMLYSGIDSIENLNQTIVQKTQESDTTYTAAGIISNSNYYYYENPNHIFVTQETHSGSDTMLIVNKIKYPMDMVSAGIDPTGVYQDMINRNMVSVPVVQDKYKNGNLLTTKTTQYRSDWFPGKSIIAPSFIEQKNGSGQSQAKLNLIRYDSLNGKLLQLAKDSDVLHSFIFDYKNALPTAEAIGTSSNDIAATSFEADGHGNFSFVGVPLADTAAFTGLKSYSLSAGNITKSGLTTSTSYIVSYWSKSGSATVNGATSSSTLTRNGWSFYQHIITGSSTITISGSVTIDELRLYPKSAQMTTYTYDPVLGMTSKTGIDSRTTYFEYDGLGRLLVIRDQDRNVSKKIKYQYQVAAVASPTVYSNTTLSHTYSRNNCGGDSTGSKFTYTIAAGTYTSSISQAYADSLARRDDSLNGQNTANANGFCQMIYYNVTKGKYYTRTNCSQGYTPSSINYVVNSGKYTSMISQSYVDSLAQSDVDSNGQAYANTYATCTLTTNRNVNYTNSATEQMTITFTNTSTSTVYTFNLPHTATSVLAGTIPSGTYNVSIAPTSGNSKLYNFKVGTFSQSSVNSMSVSNLSATANITVIISNAITQ